MNCSSRPMETLFLNKREKRRFDEFDASPLTAEAITSAGYIQMTKVQEATLAACLKGELNSHLLGERGRFAWICWSLIKTYTQGKTDSGEQHDWNGN
ncbi:hypothetical protein ACET3Z_011062 [Daucus carota]